jgi:hypothetical protein
MRLIHSPQPKGGFGKLYLHMPDLRFSSGG